VAVMFADDAELYEMCREIEEERHDAEEAAR
jgi:hypothetical protein